MLFINDLFVCALNWANYQGQPVPAIAYLPPRISQASRLLFRFLAADATNLAEMNLHPAATPICGWLLPNHLNGSLFIYDTHGASLGALFLNDSKTLIMWQAAPGSDVHGRRVSWHFHARLYR